MNRHIEAYLDDLRVALAELDKSTIQDALADAEDHLTTALLIESNEQPDVNTEELLSSIIEKYGTPEEILDQYSDIEEITTPVFARGEKKKKSTGFRGFCEVVAEPKAWAACLYMILSMGTGIFYFTWVVTGLSLSISLIVLIVGIPISILVLLSIRGLGFIEGRIVEALLGTRMPRRAITPGEGETWWAKFKIILSARSTWSTAVYMILMMPLGVTYFTLIVTLFSLGLSFVGAPIVQYVFNEPFVDPGIWVPFYAMPLVMLAGAFIIVLTLHLAKAIATLQGRFAKTMLVC